MPFGMDTQISEEGFEGKAFDPAEGVAVSGMPGESLVDWGDGH